MARVTKCIACKRPAEGRQLCKLCEASFERIYGKSGNRKEETMKTTAMRAAREATARAVEEAAPEVEVVEADEEIEEQEPVEEAAPESAPVRKLPVAARRAIKSLVYTTKVLAKFNWEKLGAAGVAGAIAVLKQATPQIEKHAAEAPVNKGGAKPSKTAPGAMVAPKVKYKKDFSELLGIDPAALLFKVISVRKQTLIVELVDPVDEDKALERLLVPASKFEAVK